MIDFPPEAPRLETARLLLAPITEDDALDYFAICSHPEVMRLHGLPAHRLVAETASLIQLLQSELAAKRMIRWGIRETGSRKLIGDVGFWRFVTPRRRAEIGAKLAPEYWSRGYMTEAIRCVLDFGFERMRLHSVEGNVDLENPASKRLVEKLGFEREGRLKEHSFCPYREKFVDTLLYSIRKEPSRG